METSGGLKKGYVFFILLLVVAAICKSLNAPLSAILVQGSGPITTMALLSARLVVFGLIVVLFSRKELKTEPGMAVVYEFPHQPDLIPRK